MCMNGCRCTVQRIRHGGHRDGQFEMQDLCTGVTLVARRAARSHTFDLYMHSRTAGAQVSYVMP